ncbi:MAG: amino acid ABC transporter substrate-binding protein [Mesorhizobium sp.]|nr:MAG: amino acid ABC transporter substrate-binding protein [Mesorhizobium sp.]
MQCAQQFSLRHHSHRQTLLVLAVAFALGLLYTVPSPAATLDRIREAHKLLLGYRPDVRPFSFAEQSGGPAGYSVSLCQKIAEEIRAELNLSDLEIEWVPVTVGEGFDPVVQGKVDLLCGPDAVTLERRKTVSFSIPIYPSGVAAMLRADAPPALRDVLEGRPPSGPIWRASPAHILEEQTFSVVAGTSAETWLSERLKYFQIPAEVVPVESFEAGVRGLLEGATDVFFGPRPILVETTAEIEEKDSLMILQRFFTHEPVALTLARNDDDFRLSVDRSLSRHFRSSEFQDTYAKWFGAPDEAVLTFFLQSALPD